MKGWRQRKVRYLNHEGASSRRGRGQAGKLEYNRDGRLDRTKEKDTRDRERQGRCRRRTEMKGNRSWREETRMDAENGRRDKGTERDM